MQEHIKRLAVDAARKHGHTIKMTPEITETLTAFAQAVARECAQIANETVCDTHIPTGIKIHGTEAAKAIRARFGLE
jgi:hypothetical protein